MTSTSTATVHMDCSFLYIIEAVLNYAEAFGLYYGVVFLEARMNDILDHMISSRYLPKNLHLSYVWYVSFACLMTKNADVLPQLESLNEGREDAKEL